MTAIIILPNIFAFSSWGDEMIFEEELADNVFVNYPRPQWEEEKRRAKFDKRFKSWGEWLSWASRIDDKRRQARQPNRASPPPTALQNLMNMRDEYVHMPSMHFASDAARDRAIRKIEKEIVAEIGGEIALKHAKLRDPVEDTEDEDNSDTESDDLDYFMFVKGF